MRETFSFILFAKKTNKTSKKEVCSKDFDACNRAKNVCSLWHFSFSHRPWEASHSVTQVQICSSFLPSLCRHQNLTTEDVDVHLSGSCMPNLTKTDQRHLKKEGNADNFTFNKSNIISRSVLWYWSTP